MGVKMEIQGLEEVKKLLAQLPNDINEKIIQDLLTSTAQIAKKEIQDSAPEGINDKKSKNKLKDGVIVKKNKDLSVLIGFKKWQGFIALLNEKGTAVRKILGKGKYKAGTNRGSMPRKPFVLDAHERASGKMIEFFSTNFGKLVNKAVKKEMNKFIKSEKD